MKEQVISKINKMGHIAGVILTICKVFVIIGMIGVLIGTAALSVLPKDFLQIQISADMALDLEGFGVDFTETEQEEIFGALTDGNTELEVGDLGFDLEDVVVDGNVIRFSTGANLATINLSSFIPLLISVFVYLVMTFVVMCFGSRLCKAFKRCENPFEADILTKMQRFGYSLIPWVVLQSVTDSIEECLMNGKISIMLNINLAMVFVVISIICLTYVFKYGAMLQQESDETL